MFKHINFSDGLSGFNTDMTPMTLLRYSCTQATRRQNVGWIM